MNDTPRTRALARRLVDMNLTSCDACTAILKHAETLERERDEWKACAEGLTSIVHRVGYQFERDFLTMARFRELKGEKE